MQVTELTPQSASYRGNRSVGGLERVLPADWLGRHEFCGDEVEVYTLGDVLVLLPSRAGRQKTVDFKQLTVGWCRVDWWRTGPHSPVTVDVAGSTAVRSPTAGRPSAG